jgi:hypothetical protein
MGLNDTGHGPPQQHRDLLKPNSDISQTDSSLHRLVYPAVFYAKPVFRRFLVAEVCKREV